jgi:hypothetical protein
MPGSGCLWRFQECTSAIFQRQVCTHINYRRRAGLTDVRYISLVLILSPTVLPPRFAGKPSEEPKAWGPLLKRYCARSRSPSDLSDATTTQSRDIATEIGPSGGPLRETTCLRSSGALCRFVRTSTTIHCRPAVSPESRGRSGPRSLRRACKRSVAFAPPTRPLLLDRSPFFPRVTRARGRPSCPPPSHWLLSLSHAA